jgi:hypothetical protein
MRVAEPAGTLPRGRNDPGGQPQNRHRRIEERDIEELTLAGLEPLDVRNQDALHGVERRQAVGDRHADLGRSRFRKPGHVHQPRLALDDHVVAGLRSAGAGGAVAGDRTVNEPPVQSAHPIGPESQPLERARPEVLDEHVGVANQVLEQLAAFRRFQIDGNALLVPVDTQEIGAPAVHERCPRSRVVAMAGVLDLDDLGAHVAEQHRAQGSGQHAGEVDHLQPVKREGSGIGHKGRVSIAGLLNNPHWPAEISPDGIHIQCPVPSEREEFWGIPSVPSGCCRSFSACHSQSHSMK